MLSSLIEKSIYSLIMNKSLHIIITKLYFQLIKQNKMYIMYMYKQWTVLLYANQVSLKTITQHKECFDKDIYLKKNTSKAGGKILN